MSIGKLNKICKIEAIKIEIENHISFGYQPGDTEDFTTAEILRKCGKVIDN
jgi:hypothetical protein